MKSRASIIKEKYNAELEECVNLLDRISEYEKEILKMKEDLKLKRVTCTYYRNEVSKMEGSA